MADDIARAIFDRAGLDGSEPKGIGYLATSLFGRSGVRFDEHQVVAFVLRSDPDRLYLSLSLDDADLSMAIARGIAAWWSLRHPGAIAEGDLEAVAVALVLPAEAFGRRLRELGANARKLARAFVCPPDVVAFHLRRLIARPARAVSRHLSVAS